MLAGLFFLAICIGLNLLALHGRKPAVRFLDSAPASTAPAKPAALAAPASRRLCPSPSSPHIRLLAQKIFRFLRLSDIAPFSTCWPPMARYIFITGGVVSSLGKGLASAALGALLQARGYKVRLRKLDPYLNVDPGTMSPYQHGEVFVTDDGAETDLDLGHYERFTGVIGHQGRQHHHRPDLQDDHREGAARRLSGRDRAGDPARHRRDQGASSCSDPGEGVDFVLVEIGGTVGDIEGLPFFEAIRQLGQELPRGHAVFIHLTLLPFIKTAGEMKTKPTQHSVKELRSIGIQPDILLCRCEQPIPPSERRKIGLFCNVRPSAVIQAMDQRRHLRRAARLSRARAWTPRCWTVFGLATTAPAPDLSRWQEITDTPDQPGRRGHHRRGRQVHGAEGRLQIADRGPDPRRRGQQRQGQASTGSRARPSRARRARSASAWLERPRRPGARRLRRARLGGQDPRGPVRPRARHALFRHLLRHADGGDRGGAEPGRHQAGLVHRVRPDAGARWSA